MSDGATTSTPASAWAQRLADQHLDGLSLSDVAVVVGRPSWPWLVYGSSATSVIMPSSGKLLA
jgi:hypothetical protein